MAWISGWLIGWSGTVSEVAEFTEWFGKTLKKQPCKPPKDVGWTNMMAMVVSPGGDVYEYRNNTMPFRCHAKYYAIGSGSDFALGAMAHGATAYEAVIAAIAHDVNSGIPIIEMEWKPPKKTRRRK